MPDHSHETPLTTKATATDAMSVGSGAEDMPRLGAELQSEKRSRSEKPTAFSARANTLPTTPPTVLIVGDQAEAECELSGALQRRGYMTVEASVADDALCLLNRLDISVAIVEPDFGDARRISRDVSKRWPEVPLLIDSSSRKSAETVMRKVSAICPPAKGS